MSECVHIIGEASGEGDYQDISYLVEAGSEVEARHHFDPFSFCPRCGASVSEEASDAAVAHSLRAAAVQREDKERRAQWEARAKMHREVQQVIDPPPPPQPETIEHRWIREVMAAWRGNKNPYFASFSSAEYQQKEFASNLLQQKEERIIDAVKRALGREPVAEDFAAGRLRELIFPGGCSVFTLDGKPFLQVDTRPDGLGCDWRESDFRDVAEAVKELKP